MLFPCGTVVIATKDIKLLKTIVTIHRRKVLAKRGERQQKQPSMYESRFPTIHLFLWLLAAQLVAVSSQQMPIAVYDAFKLKDGQLKMQHYDASLNLTWHTQTYDDMTLHLLANDIISGDTLDTCIMPSSDAMPSNAGKQIFKDIAKVGFHIF